LIAHGGGKCDQDYLDKQKSVPGLPPLAIGEPLQLDGEMVVGLVKPVSELCGGLLTKVTAWIKIEFGDAAR
jgi:hypothetical protein